MYGTEGEEMPVRGPSDILPWNPELMPCPQSDQSGLMCTATPSGFASGEARRPRNPRTRALPGIRLLILILSVLPGTAVAEVQVVFTEPAGECTLSLEADDTERTLRLRVHPESSACHIPKETMLAALKGASSATNPSPLSGRTYTSLSIGRLVAYPWISQHLATTAYRDPAWDAKRGRPRHTGENTYVAKLLAEDVITGPLNETLAPRGLRIHSVTVEKVLVGGFRDVPLYQGKDAPGKVPYDAQVWLRLQRN